ncbi:MAG: hypothetical protein IPJ76_13885 [Flavobacteriales bacterium]|nr:MAG: hypothetical protein IPJ76_13885 [Flavobacteriales bacterium]
MPIPLIVALVIYFLCAYGARRMTERAQGNLPDEQKVLLMDAFRGMRTNGLAVAMLMLAVVIGLPFLLPDSPRLVFSVAGILMTAVMVVRQTQVRNKLHALNIDEAYVRAVGRAQLLTGMGLAVVVAMFVWTFSFGDFAAAH